MLKRTRFATRLVSLAAAVLLAAACSDSTPPPAAKAANAASAAQPKPAEQAQQAKTASPAASAAPKAPLLEQEVAYGEAQRRNLVGFLAMPGDAAEPLPGLIVIHEWWGLNDNIKAMTRKLASEGYVALAVDLYGGAKAETPEKARPLMAAVVDDQEAARANLKQAYDYLEKYALAPRIGSVGWSFGGGWSLQTALMLPDHLRAMVMYYGPITGSQSELSTLQMPVLGFFAGLDESIPARDVQLFRSTLLKLGKPAEIIIYPKAQQGFANPDGGAYDEQAATESWQKTLAFLAENLKSKPR
jgi:carboxymethylenebutenolidase